MPVDEFGNEIEEEGGEQEQEQTPQYASAASVQDMQQLLKTMQEQMTVMATSFNALAAQRAATGQVQPEPEIPDLSDEELEEIIASGQGGKKLKQAIKAAEARVRREVSDLQTVGLGAISNVVREMAMKDMPHYERFKDEIESILGSLAPQARLDPGTYKRAYGMVIGMHFDELRDEAVRESRQPKAPLVNTPGAVNGRSRSGEPAEDEEMYEISPETKRTLREMGLTKDEYAKRVWGYNSWKDYVNG